MLTIIGCSEDHPLIDTVSEPSLTKIQVENSIFMMDLNAEQLQINKINAEDLVISSGLKLKARSNNSRANGDFILGGLLPIEFSAVQNNGGIHGDLNLGTAIGNFLGEASCLTIEDNHAVAGFQITGVSNPDFSFLINLYLYIQVVDNGEGANASADQMYSTIFITNLNDCEFFCPDCIDWLSEGPLTDISDGNIQVH